MSCELEELRCPSRFSQERTKGWRSVRPRGRVEDEEEKERDLPMGPNENASATCSMRRRMNQLFVAASSALRRKLPQGLRCPSSFPKERTEVWQSANSHGRGEESRSLSIDSSKSASRASLRSMQYEPTVYIVNTDRSSRKTTTR
jgi:hypothetical protein